MNILALSDLHAEFDAFCPGELPEADLVLFAGDLTDMGVNGSSESLIAAERWLREMAERYPQVLAIPGNHDVGFRPDTFPNIPRVQWIQGTTVTLEADPAVTLHGVNLSPSYLMPELVSKLDFMTVDHAAEDKAYEFEPVTIVLSHAPPYGILDTDGADPETGEPLHIGSQSLMDYMNRNHPRFVVCGHVHAAHGSRQVELAGHIIKVYNVAQMYRVFSI